MPKKDFRPVRFRRIYLQLGMFLFCVGWCAACLQPGVIVLEDHPKTLSVQIVENRTYEYGVEERFTDFLVQEFLRDGRLQVVSPKQADLLLNAILTQYSLRPISYDQNEQAVVFDLQASLLVTLKDQRTGKILFEKEPFQESGIFLLSNQPEARREEQVFVCLAEAMISRILEGW